MSRQQHSCAHEVTRPHRSRALFVPFLVTRERQRFGVFGQWSIESVQRLRAFEIGRASVQSLCGLLGCAVRGGAARALEAGRGGNAASLFCDTITPSAPLQGSPPRPARMGMRVGAREVEGHCVTPLDYGRSLMRANEIHAGPRGGATARGHANVTARGASARHAADAPRTVSLRRRPPPDADRRARRRACPYATASCGASSRARAAWDAARSWSRALCSRSR